MANRLEKNGPARERARLKAQLAELTAGMQAETAGKKQQVNEAGHPVGQFGLNVGRQINQGLSGTSGRGFNPMAQYGQSFGQGSVAQPQQFGGGISPYSGSQAIYGNSGGFQPYGSGFGNQYGQNGLTGSQQPPPGGQGGPQGLPQWAQIGLGAASFLGGAYDVGRGLKEPTKLNAQDYYNPQYSSSLGRYNKGLSLLADRRYNATPELQDVERQSAIYQQGLRNTGNIGAGGLRNQLAGLQSRRQGARGNIFAKKQNVDLGMMGEEAQGMFRAGQLGAQLGQQRAATDFSIADWNERSAAGGRNLVGAGLANLGLGAQTQQLMANQKYRDEQRLGVIDSYGGGQYTYGGDGSIQFGQPGMNQFQRRRNVRGF